MRSQAAISGPDEVGVERLRSVPLAMKQPWNR
jgi:hypothetical protein